MIPTAIQENKTRIIRIIRARSGSSKQPTLLEDLPMSDAVKVGFVPFSAASRGILVVFCDDGAEVWRRQPESAGDSGQYHQARGGHQPVQGQERLDAGHPGARGNQGAAPDRDRRRQTLQPEGEGFSQVRRRDRRQAQRRQRCRHHYRRNCPMARWRRTKRPRSRRASAYAPTGSTATRPRRRTARTARCVPRFRLRSAMSAPREKPSRRNPMSSMA